MLLFFCRITIPERDVARHDPRDIQKRRVLRNRQTETVPRQHRQSGKSGSRAARKVQEAV